MTGPTPIKHHCVQSLQGTALSTPQLEKAVYLFAPTNGSHYDKSYWQLGRHYSMTVDDSAMRCLHLRHTSPHTPFFRFRTLAWQSMHVMELKGPPPLPSLFPSILSLHSLSVFLHRVTVSWVTPVCCSCQLLHRVTDWHTIKVHLTHCPTLIMSFPSHWSKSQSHSSPNCSQLTFHFSTLSI